MSYRLSATFTVSYVGDGAGPMEVPGSPSIKILSQFSGTVALQGPLEIPTVVPGANAPSQANFNTAIDAVGTDIKGQISANGSALLTRLQGFATGITG